MRSWVSPRPNPYYMGEEREGLGTSTFRHKRASQLSTSLTFRGQSTPHVILWVCCHLGMTAPCAQLTHNATRCRVPKSGRLWGCNKDPTFSKDWLAPEGKQLLVPKDANPKGRKGHRSFKNTISTPTHL